MAHLVAIGYDDETTASAAAREVSRLSRYLGVLYFGVVVGGLGALLGKVEKSGLDKEFQDQLRDMVQPGTSALFLVVERATPDKAVEAMSKFGGTVLKTSLSKDAEHELQDALHGTPVSA